MPRGDGTGPWGLGPMTGRGAGFCAGYPAPGFVNPIPGRGWPRGRGGGRGFGMGRGRGRGFHPYGYAPYAFDYGYPAYAPSYSPTYADPAYNPTSSQPAYGYSGYPQLTKDQELKMLQEEASALKSEMETIETRIKELGKAK